MHLVGELHVANRDVDRAEREPVRMVDAGRDAESKRRYALLRQLADDRRELVEERRLRGRHGRAFDRLVHRPVLVDDPGENLGPAQIDADHASARPWRR